MRQLAAGMGSQERAARKRFDSWAPRYGQDLRSRFNARPRRQALASLILGPQDTLLDVGCGTGEAVREAAATVARAVGLDVSPAMIEQARERAAGLVNVEFVVGSSVRLPFASQSFSAVLCTAAFHHYPDPEQALGEMARVLAPGGRLALSDGTADKPAARAADWLLRRVDSSHVRLYSSETLLALVGAAGFVDVALTWVYEGGLGIVTARRSGQG